MTVNKFFNHKPFLFSGAAILAMGVAWYLLRDYPSVGYISAGMILIVITYLLFSSIKK